jgi:methylase of polypeptide subunit release factors
MSEMEFNRSNVSDKEPYHQEAIRILEQSQRDHSEPYLIEMLGKQFIVNPNVFPPSYFLDTPFFAEHLPVTAGDRLLEIGSGSGVVSVLAALRGARVTATDINPAAVANTQANIDLHGLRDRIDARLGDVYSPLHADERFDSIFWNLPWGYATTPLPMLERALFDEAYQSIKTCIRGARDHLSDQGKLYFGFSPMMGRWDLLSGTLNEVECSEVKSIASVVLHARQAPLDLELIRISF